MAPRHLKKFARLIDTHVDPDAGITNEMIERLCEEISTEIAKKRKKKRKFVRVVSSPKVKAKSLRPFKDGREKTFIINLITPPFKREGHFVFVCISRRHILYIDPYGEMCSPLSPFRKKLSDLGVPIRYSTRRVQALDSKACGLFCVLFVLQRERERSFKELKWKTRKLKANDTLCVRYIKEVIKSI